MKYRRWLPRFDPNLRTTVNLSETYRGHDLHVFISRVGLASTTCAVYVDGKRVAFDIVLGSEPEVMIVGLRAGLRVIDELLGGEEVDDDETARATPRVPATFAD